MANEGRYGFAGGVQATQTIENDADSLTSDQHYLYWRWTTGINLETTLYRVYLLRIWMKNSFAGTTADAKVSLRIPRTAPEGERGTEYRPIGGSDGNWTNVPFYIQRTRVGLRPGEYWYRCSLNWNPATSAIYNAQSVARSGEASLYVGNLQNRTTKGYHPWLTGSFTNNPTDQSTGNLVWWGAGVTEVTLPNPTPLSSPTVEPDALELPDLAWIYAKTGAAISKIMPEATGGKTPRTYYATDIPAGLNFEPGARELRGTLTTAGSAYELTYGCRDAEGTIVTKEQRLHISDEFEFVGRISDLTRRENDGTHTFTIPEVRGNVGAVSYTLETRNLSGATLATTPANRYVLGDGVVTVSGTTIERIGLILKATDGQGEVDQLNWQVETVAASTARPETLGAWNFELDNIEVYANETVVEIAPHFSYNNGTSCVEYLRSLNEDGDEDGDPWTEYSRERVPRWIFISQTSPQRITVRAPEHPLTTEGRTTYKMALYCGNSDGSVATNQYQKFEVVVLDSDVTEDDSADYFFVLYGDSI